MRKNWGKLEENSNFWPQNGHFRPKNTKKLEFFLTFSSNFEHFINSNSHFIYFWFLKKLVTFKKIEILDFFQLALVLKPNFKVFENSNSHSIYFQFLKKLATFENFKILDFLKLTLVLKLNIDILENSNSHSIYFGFLKKLATF